MNSCEKTCNDSITMEIMDMIRFADHKFTPLDLQQKICCQGSASAKAVRRAIKNLIADNRLAYTQFMGRTFVEISYKRAVNAARGIILSPPDAAVKQEAGRIVVRIMPGAAFGMGDHPTTRICLELLAFIFENEILPDNSTGFTVMDVGTGSGVLAIAACLMGAHRAAGIDIDACARVEAAQNAALNGLKHRMEIFSSISEAKEKNPDLFPFHLILANLRYPTLTDMPDIVSDICMSGAVLIFSGFRPHEKTGLLEVFAPEKFKLLRTAEQNGWAGIVFRRKS
jgi:ribosomal protein L11 methyltransferase